MQRVDRNEIIPVSKIRKHSKAVNPATGQPYFFWFIDNTSHSVGTYESPFSTLVNAQNASSASDVIYVFPGNGTSAGMDAGIILKDNQKLFGAGINQSLRTTLGRVSIPALANQFPLITNAGIIGGGDVVVCHTNNEVSGCNLQNINPATSSSGCINILNSSATIINNILTTFNGSNALSFVNNTTAFGTVIISNNTILSGDATDTFGIAVNTFGTSSGTFIIQNNLFSGSAFSSGLDQAISILNASTSNETVTLSISNNIFNSQTNSAVNFPLDPPAGINCEVLSGSTQALALFIHGNQIVIPGGISNPLAGISITQDAGALSTVLIKATNNVSITPVGVPGYQFVTNTGNISLMQLYFINNEGTFVGP